MPGTTNHLMKNPGIRYYSEFISCIPCKMRVCQNCHRTHSKQHSPQIRVKTRQWMEKSKEYSQVAQCSACSGEVRARFNCGIKDCNYALCIGCVLNEPHRKGKFAMLHMTKDSASHRMFYAILPTFWFTTPAWKVNPCPCYDLSRPVTPGHCARCHSRKSMLLLYLI